MSKEELFNSNILKLLMFKYVKWGEAFCELKNNNNFRTADLEGTLMDLPVQPLSRRQGRELNFQSLVP